MRTAYRNLFDTAGPLSERIDAVAAGAGDSKPVSALLDFIRGSSKRGLLYPRRRDGAG